MMFRLEAVGNSTFLVYDTEEEKVDALGLGMLSNNAIDGLLKFSCVRKDESILLNYDVTAMIPLSQYFENYLHMDQVIHIFQSIVSGIISAEEYMLDIGKLMLDGEHIYIGVNSGNCRLLYLPAAGMEREPDLVEVFKRLLLEIRYDAQSDNAYMTDIINYLNSSPKLDYRKFGQWLSEFPARKERAGEPVYRKSQPGPEYGFRQPEAVIGKEGTGINPPEIPLVRTADRPVNGNGGQQQEEKKKGFFQGFGGRGKEEKKEEKRQDNKQDKKLEKKQEKEEKKQEKLREKQIKKEAKKNGKNNGKNNGKSKEVPKAASVNPYFAIPGQGGPESIGAGMAVPGAGRPESAGAGMAVPNSGRPASDAVQPVRNAGMPVPESPHSAVRGENGYAVREEGRMGLDFGDTVVMDEQEDSSTVIISSQMQIADGIPYLKRMKNGQKMYMDKPLMKIGREGKYVDFYIGDNPSVSRSHADIIRENDAYYIRDNNSSNHTYVESEMLTGGQKVKLWHGAKIRISDEEFVFYMY